MGLNKTKWIFSFALGILFTGSLGFSDTSDFNKDLQSLGFSEESIQKINEKLDGRTIPSGKAIEVFNWLQKIGIKNPSALIEKIPSILRYSTEENLQPKIEWLKRIGIKSPSVLIEKFPAVLGLSLSENLRPKVTWLKRIGIKSPSVLIEKFPQIFGYSIIENLEPTFKELTQHWNIPLEYLEDNYVLFGASLKRVVEMRETVDRLCFLTTQKKFNFSLLSKSHRSIIVSKLSSQDFLGHLQEALGSDIPIDIENLSEEHFEKIRALFKSGNIKHLLKKRVNKRALKSIADCLE